MVNAIIIPIGISFDKWVAHLNPTLPDYYIPLSFGEKYWRDWTNQLINANALWTVPVATKLGFPETKDWIKWASRFIQTITAL